jgi:TolA-binding protein
MAVSVMGNEQAKNSGRFPSLYGADRMLAWRRIDNFETMKACSSIGGRQLIFPGRVPLLSLVGLLILISICPACKKKATAPPPATIQNMAQIPPSAPSAPPAITPGADSSSKSDSTEPALAPTVPVAPTSFDLGMTDFRAGEYGKAAQLFDEYLQAGTKLENRDFVLFHLYLSRKLMGNSGRNAHRAEDALKRIVNEFPESPYGKAAEYILGLQAQIESLRLDNKEKEVRIKQLSDELQKLKDIDMQRRPSRPLY